MEDDEPTEKKPSKDKNKSKKRKKKSAQWRSTSISM
jgi:hypothetical protein